MKIEIEADEAASVEGLHRFVRHRVDFALGPREDQILSVKLQISGAKEMRDGKDKRCRVLVTLSDHQRVMVESMDANLYVSVHRAVDRAGWTVARQLARQQRSPGNRLVMEHYRGDVGEPERAA